LKLIRIKPNLEQSTYVRSILGDTINKQWRNQLDGDPEKRFIGYLSEIIISDFLCIKRKGKTEGFDGGYDLKINNKKYDVKTSIRKVDFRKHYDHLVMSLKMKYNTDGYIFVSYNKLTNVFFICGYINKKDFLKYCEFYPGGSCKLKDDGTELKFFADTFQINNKYLKPIFDLKKGVKRWVN